MPMHQTTLRLGEEEVEAIDQLISWLQQRPYVNELGTDITRAAVLRMACVRGLRALTMEMGNPEGEPGELAAVPAQNSGESRNHTVFCNNFSAVERVRLNHMLLRLETWSGEDWETERVGTPDEAWLASWCDTDFLRRLLYTEHGGIMPLHDPDGSQPYWGSRIIVGERDPQDIKP